MEGWRKKWKDGRMDGGIEGGMEGWGGWRSGRREGWKAERKGGWKAGWTDGCLLWLSPHQGMAGWRSWCRSCCRPCSPRQLPQALLRAPGAQRRHSTPCQHPGAQQAPRTGRCAHTLRGFTCPNHAWHWDLLGVVPLLSPISQHPQLSTHPAPPVWTQLHHCSPNWRELVGCHI